ncbi:Ribosomal-protein-serine acetyltransferase [Clavibacter michiganensis]|uniref:Ribosomal-protein-serine acetyltransferase n=1 Tax=Clavibacter michiganensis TaxID=28447 RepID=A0A251YBV3_9MICO|nr:GNAT family N-acetyltransferase [Clavibacter michiganensis]OUE21731.1 Ribosomal-protein-serine acetyltransferase [Clavibacter michiganensis]
MSGPPPGTDERAVLADGVVMRPARITDAAALAAAYRDNREHLRPFEPARTDAFFTAAGQRAQLAGRIAERAAGSGLPYLVVEGDRIIGRCDLFAVKRGAAQSASLGYWIDRERQGAGLATAAAREAVRIARAAGLHRLEASTLVGNGGSEEVLTRAGFARVGIAPAYLRIDGAWSDHTLWQRVVDGAR